MTRCLFLGLRRKNHKKKESKIAARERKEPSKVKEEGKNEREINVHSAGKIGESRPKRKNVTISDFYLCEWLL